MGTYPFPPYLLESFEHVMTVEVARLDYVGLQRLRLLSGLPGGRPPSGSVGHVGDPTLLPQAEMLDVRRFTAQIQRTT